jgi:LPXTG-motif cell wall-anchored protein
VSAWTLAALGVLLGVVAFVALRRKNSSASR